MFFEFRYQINSVGVIQTDQIEFFINLTIIRVKHIPITYLVLYFNTSNFSVGTLFIGYIYFFI